MSTDAGIKLFGKTIAMPFCSDEGGGEGYDKCSPRDKEYSTNSEEKTDPMNMTRKNSCEESQNEVSNREGKPQLKKPDKILACPRCKSMETKFCYYNNYNINQPRHFCKNCQRYWTAGGTMRNMPVGAGRRRSKSSANSQFQHQIISDATLKASGSTRVLSFASDAASNKHKTLTSNPADLQWAPWPYPWAPPPTPMLYPGPPCWGYGTPWISPIVMTSSSSSAWTLSNQSSFIPGHVSPLGKHLRETNVTSKECTSDSGSSGGRKGNIWIPKTLRIDDPEEAAKSSIWATMGFDNDKSDKGIFKVFPNKSVELKADNNSHSFNVNPASFSRSVNFQESS